MSEIKRFFSFLLSVIAGAVIGILIFALITRNNDSAPVEGAVILSTDTGSISGDVLTDLAFEVTEAIKYSDYELLAKYVHPEYGIVFSPYATVNLSSNKWFSVDQVQDFSNDTEQYIWGLTSDGGEPIQMSVSDYFSRYVFNYDYTVAPLIGINYIVRSGNTVENVTEAFPGAQFVDLCYPGTAENENQDWSTLRLVFESYNDRLMLTAIIHSEYII